MSAENSTAPDAPPRSRGVSAAVAALIGLLIGALIGAMVALPIANNARLARVYPRAVMNLMERDYDQLFDLAAQGQCSEPRFDQRLRRMRSLAEDTPTAFNAADDADFVSANQALIDALDRAAAERNCGQMAEALDRIDRACESCHTDYR